MIFVHDKLLAPRDTEVVSIASNDKSKYLYMSLDVVELLITYSRNDIGFDVSKSNLIGDEEVSPKATELAAIVLSNFEKKWIQAVAAFLLLLPDKYIPTFESDEDKLLFACMALDTIISSVNIDAYVKYQRSSRPDLTSTFRMLRHYKSRSEQIFGMWFTGIVITPITNVQYVTDSGQPVNVPEKDEKVKHTASKTVQVGGIADMIQEPTESNNTISEDDYEALMAELSAIDESYEKIKAEPIEDKDGNKQVIVEPEVKRRNDAQNLLSSLMTKF